MMAFGLDCQEVMSRRLLRIARGDGGAILETQRMFVEKATVATIAGMTAAFAWPLGAEVALQRAAVPYRKAVRANRTRLRRG